MKNNHTNLYNDSVTMILKKIKSQRALKGYGQEYMGERLGFDHSGYGRIENGISPLKMHLVFKIAEILEIDIEDLFTFGNAEPQNKKCEELAIKIRIELPLNYLDGLL